MVKKLTPDIKKARKLRERGTGLALENEGPSWLEQAQVFLRRYQQRKFTGEQFRVWAINNGLPHPHTSHVWGAFWNSMQKANVIRKHGMEVGQMQMPKSHGHNTPYWSKV